MTDNQLAGFFLALCIITGIGVQVYSQLNQHVSTQQQVEFHGF